ncbi:MAG: tRNA lysidine(34) synthetase TilS [Gammaproteobacteria bacterium]|nr:tRNA lysidine(34) synthetase TilS [Gammaproteobacteria bacterium]
MNAPPVDLEEKLRSQLAEFPYRRLYVGFSGGLDSTVLLHVGRAVQADVTALHVNHGLQPDAVRWESHCSEFCGQLGVRFVSSRAEPGDGSEGAARAARYAVFDNRLDVDDLLLLGHHEDDQAETVLMRLVQGRAPLGMPRTRRLHCGARILRPWLATPKEALLRHAREAGLDWVEDPSNARVDHDRNFLRREIVPRLAGRWPDVGKTLAASAAMQFARDALLDHLADGVSAAPPVAGTTPDGGGELALREFPAELRVPVLQLWLRGLGEFSTPGNALAEFARQFDAPPDAHPRLDLRHGVLRRHGEKAVYTGPDFELHPRYRLDLPGVLALPHGILSVERQALGFHAAGPLEVRFRGGGERLRSRGRTRSVKKLLHGAGVPPWQRRTWPLVYSGDALICIPGIAIADSPEKEPRWRVAWHPEINR